MKKTSSLLKVLPLIAILIFGVSVNASAEIYIVACFEDSTENTFLNPKDSPIDFSQFTKTTGQDCIQLLETSYSFEQSFTIGSQSSGVGAGKATFNEFAFKKTIDTFSPQLLSKLVDGSYFKSVNVFFFKAVPGNISGFTAIMTLQLGLVGVKKIDIGISAGDEALNEAIALEYGEIKMTAYKFDPAGKRTIGPQKGWSRVTNSNNFQFVNDTLQPL